MNPPAVASTAHPRGHQPILIDPGVGEYAIWAVGGGLIIGASVAVTCRVLGLRWTWALVLACAIPAAWLIEDRLGVAVVGGMLVGAVLCAQWEREDAERGGQERQRVRQRPGLFGAIWSLYAVRRWRPRVRGNRVAIGQTRSRTVVTVPFGNGEGTRGFVSGAPGSGKTVDIVGLAAAYIAERLSVVCIDPKGDRSLEDGLRAAAGTASVRFTCWAPDGEVFYNPLARGGPTEIADKALAGEEWTEPHYLRQAQRYVGAVVRGMQAAGEWPPSLSTVVRYFDSDRFDNLAGRGGEDSAEQLRDYLDSLSQRTRQELGGVRDRLAVLGESELGGRLEPHRGFEELKLEETLRSGAVAYFRLDSDRYPLAAQMLGAAIVSDLVNLTGQLQREPIRGLVVVDEFAAVAADEVSRLLGRSRSAGLSVVVATQTFADLDQARLGDSTESLRRQVLANVDFAIAHRQSEPEAAETLAAMAGTRATWATTRRVGSVFQDPWTAHRREGTRTREREFVRHPDEFKRLRVGEAIVIEPASGHEAEIVRMWTTEA